MSQIKVELQYWSGDDLAVIKAAKESFNRKADWEYCNAFSLDDECKLKSDGWEWDADCDEGGQRYRRLKMRDQDLLRMLARGMGQKEYADLLEQVRVTNDPDVVESLMWKFRHTTPHLAPFGHCFATFRFRAPVFVMRHIVKHEYIRISELSMRYVRGMPEYFKPKSWRAMADDVKQGSGLESVNEFTASHLDQYLDMAHDEDGEAYRRMIDPNGADKLCPEQARTFLRLCHMTEGTLSGSMDAIAGIVTKRLDPHAQEETREFARQIDQQMYKPYPMAWAALTEGLVR